METLLMDQDEAVLRKKQLDDALFSFIPGIEKPMTVPVLDATTLKEYDFKKEWVSRNKACLVKGAVRHWPAVEKWRDKNYWIATCENFEVSVYPHQNFIDKNRQSKGLEKMGFHDAIERLFQNKDYIFSIPGEQIDQENRFCKIRKEIEAFSFLPAAPMPRWYERMRFFIYRRAATAWHFHGVDETLMCQVNGTKRVCLLSPQIPNPKLQNFF